MGEIGAQVGNVSLEVFRRPDETIDAPREFRVPEGVRVERSGKPTSDSPAKGVTRTIYPLRVHLQPDKFPSQSTPRQLISLGVVTARGEQSTLPLTWTVEEAIVAKPGRLHFNYTEDGGSETATVLVRSTEVRPFRILSVDGDKSSSVELEKPERIGPRSKPNVSHVLTLRVQPSLNIDGRSAAGTVVVETDDAPCSRVLIHWSGFVARPSSVGAAESAK
jgi:hypothetical protein